MNWREVMQLPAEAVTAEQIDHQYRTLAKQRHPDAGGSNEAMAELNEAKQIALKEIAAPPQPQHAIVWPAAAQQQQTWTTESAFWAQVNAAQQAAAFQQAAAQSLYGNSAWVNAMLGGLGGLGSRR